MAIHTSGNQKIQVKLLLSWAIALGIPFMIWCVPLNELFTREIRLFLVLSIMLILVVAFELFNNFLIPAFLLPAGYTLAKVVPATEAYSSWTQTVLYVIISAFILASVLEEVGLLKRLAYWCIVKFGGTYQGVYWGTFCACTLVSMATFGNAYAVMAPFCYGVCQALGLGRSKESALIMMSGLIGTVTTRIFIWTPQKVGLVEAGVAPIIPGFSIPWNQLLWHMFPVALYCLFLLWFLGKLFKIKQVTIKSGKEYFVTEYQKLGSVTLPEKKAAFVLMLLMAYLLTNPIHGYDVFYGFLVIVPMLFMPGINVGSKASVKSVDFGMIFFIASCLAIGTVGTKLGIGTLLSDLLGPALQQLSATASVLGILIFGIVINFILTPTAMLTALPGPLTQVALDLGMNPLPFMYSLIISCDMVFLPYEYVPFLIFFSFGMMSLGDFLKLSLIKIILCLITTAGVLVPFWIFLGIL